jgi:hypothetical protein
MKKREGKVGRKREKEQRETSILGGDRLRACSLLPPQRHMGETHVQVGAIAAQTFGPLAGGMLSIEGFLSEISKIVGPVGCRTCFPTSGECVDGYFLSCSSCFHNGNQHMRTLFLAHKQTNYNTEMSSEKQQGIEPIH